MIYLEIIIFLKKEEVKVAPSCDLMHLAQNRIKGNWMLNIF